MIDFINLLLNFITTKIDCRIYIYIRVHKLGLFVICLYGRRKLRFTKLQILVGIETFRNNRIQIYLRGRYDTVVFIVDYT